MAIRETSRTVLVLSKGSKLCLMGAALLLVLAWYALFSGIQRPGSAGNNFPFLCGSGAHPPTDAFPKAACGYENRNRRDQAIGYAVAAIILGGGGVLTFGSSGRQEQPLVDPAAVSGTG